MTRLLPLLVLSLLLIIPIVAQEDTLVPINDLAYQHAEMIIPASDNEIASYSYGYSTLSPDGCHVAWYEEYEQALCLYTLADGRVVCTESPVLDSFDLGLLGVQAMYWSPDSTIIALPSPLAIIDTATLDIHYLDLMVDNQPLSEVFYSHITWDSPNTFFVMISPLVSSDNTLDALAGIYHVDLNTEQATRIVDLASMFNRSGLNDFLGNELSLTYPLMLDGGISISPNNQQIAWIIGDPSASHEGVILSPENDGIWLKNLNDNELHHIASPTDFMLHNVALQPRAIAWNMDGTSLYLWATSEQDSDILGMAYSMDVETRAITPLMTLPDNMILPYVALTPARDGILGLTVSDRQASEAQLWALQMVENTSQTTLLYTIEDYNERINSSSRSSVANTGTLLIGNMLFTAE